MTGTRKTGYTEDRVHGRTYMSERGVISRMSQDGHRQRDHVPTLSVFIDPFRIVSSEFC